MIHDMASLKQAMEQMDADDMATSQAAKDRAARILADSNLSFSKIAELIEQRRLLLRPKIVASIKRMDQPEMLGDAAFRDAGTSLRREGQSFRQIAEALELNGGPAPRNADPVRKGDGLLNQMEMDGKPAPPAWPRILTYVLRVVLFPIQHPIRFLVITLLAVVLYNALHDSGRQVSGYVAVLSAARQRADAIVSSVSSFFAASPPTPPAPSPSPAEASPSATPSPGPTTAASTPPAATPTPQASAASPSPASTPRPDARSSSSSTVAANNRPRTAGPRAFDDLMPTGLRRNSRSGGSCIAGVGGCYWGGARY